MYNGDYESWFFWEEQEPDPSNTGSIEAVHYFDGLPITNTLSLYHYANGESKWGYSVKKDGRWETHHPKFYRWRYINGKIPTAEQQDSTILVWEWRDAPGELRSYSTHGGDEDWVALVPKGMDTPYWMECEPFSICRNDSIELSDGRVVIITAHA